MATVKRTIHFYRMVAFDKTKEPPKRADLLRAIAKIVPSTPEALYDNGNNENLCIWNDTPLGTKVNEVKFCLGKIRQKNIPGTVVKGSRQSLSANNVFEPCHMVMFDNYVLGVEWNQYGPRATSTLPRYLSEKCTTLPVIYLKPLYDEDILETLNRFDSLSVMRIELEREKVGSLLTADKKLSTACKNIVDPYPSAILDVSIRIQPATKYNDDKKIKEKERTDRHLVQKQFSHALYEEVSALVKDASAISGMSKFEVHGYDKRTKNTITLDLLERNIIAKKRVLLVDATHGMVDPEAMYAGIIEAHTEMKEIIEAAVAVGKKGEK